MEIPQGKPIGIARLAPHSKRADLLGPAVRLIDFFGEGAGDVLDLLAPKGRVVSVAGRGRGRG